MQLKDKLITNDWISADWDTYIKAIESPDREKDRGYYYNRHMRIEDMPTGPDHSRYQSVMLFAINLYCTIKGIDFNGLDNCSYRKVGVRECQPDLSYYIQDRAKLAPIGTSVVNADEQSPPDLVIEISNTTLSDDLGKKRLLYEEIGASEYWVVDVQGNEVIAFQISDRGSKRIDTSIVLPQLSISLVSEALKRSREVSQFQIGQWLMTEFQK